MKTRIWGLPVRLFHLIIFSSFTVAYLLSEDGPLRLHTAFGSAFTIMIAFRIIYGFIGPKYAKFSDFKFTPTNIKFMLGNFRETHSKYPGHNPMASGIMLSIIIVGLFTGITGALNLSAEYPGLIPFINIGESEFVEEAHELLANFLLILVGFHLLGLIIDVILLKSKTSLFSIFTGNKPIEAEESKTNAFPWIVAILFMILASLSFYNFASNDSIIKKDNQEQFQETED